MIDALLSPQPDLATLLPNPGWTDCDCDVSASALLSRLGIRRAVGRQLPDPTPTRRPTSEPNAFATRFVIDAPSRPDPATLRDWHARGVRGLRFMLGSDPAGVSAQGDAIERLADSIAPFDWHLELTLGGATASLATLEWTLMCLPVAICLDGIADVAAARDTAAPDLGLVLDLMQIGRTWIKLSPASCGDVGRTHLAAFVDKAVATRPDRIVWGSGGRRADEVARTLADLTEWIPDPLVRDTVLTANPARLYHF